MISCCAFVCMYTSKYLCMWQGVCSHLSRWYPFQVVCARVHHLTCAFTHMQRIHGSMLDSLSVSMSVSVNVYEARSCPVISFPSASTHSLASTITSVGGGAGSYASRSEGKNTSRTRSQIRTTTETYYHTLLALSSPSLLDFLSFALTFFLR